ncbi:hypothetical protein PENTCL1PPCAC_29195 [Pristionchus entomophagus]|uniref:Uncharacterized protein n=1 Tax=Pristionchus entomophagus TaxID=358040 RepID=A0AAV5UJ28_9BILA|nr:hypothetical protein PENTCL1PPCAC_29195 [Pristionchus entomophagus]
MELVDVIDPTSDFLARRVVCSSHEARSDRQSTLRRSLREWKHGGGDLRTLSEGPNLVMQHGRETELVDEMDGLDVADDGSTRETLQRLGIPSPMRWSMESRPLDCHPSNLRQALVHVEVRQRRHLQIFHSSLGRKCLCVFSSYGAIKFSMQSIADENARNPGNKLIDFPQPSLHPTEAPSICDVVNEQNAMGSSRIPTNDRREAPLTRSIPGLYIDGVSVQENSRQTRKSRLRQISVKIGRVDFRQTREELALTYVSVAHEEELERGLRQAQLLAPVGGRPDVAQARLAHHYGEESGTKSPEWTRQYNNQTIGD